jgi:hypothetical protein
MCGPAAIPIAIALVGTAVTVYGQQQSAKAQKQAADYNARQDQYNSDLQGKQAQDARDRGAAAAADSLKDTSRRIGEGRVAWAGSGVDLNSGSAALWETDALKAGLSDAEAIKYNAEQQALGFEGQAYNSRASANLNRARGSNAIRAGNTQAASSLLAGAGQAYGYLDT